MQGDDPIYLILYIENDGTYSQYKTTNQDAEYGVYALSDDGYIDGSFVSPRVKESATGEIPFVIINTNSVSSTIEKPFLESSADASIKLFQASATYEDTLYWGGQSTLFTQNFGGKDNPVKVGNGAVNVTTAEHASAHYATAGVDGIEPNKQNVDDLKNDCIALGVDLINQGVESGVALDTRMSVKTASLKTLAQTGALGLGMVIKMGAIWSGYNADEVVIMPNTSFSNEKYTADDLLKLNAIVQSGGMAKESFYNILKKQEITSADSYDDWLLILETESMQGATL